MVDRRAEDLGGLQLGVGARVEGGRKWKEAHVRPCEGQRRRALLACAPRQDRREQARSTAADLRLCGGYSAIVRPNLGQISAISPPDLDQISARS